jgi:hypothetical protein
VWTTPIAHRPTIHAKVGDTKRWVATAELDYGITHDNAKANAELIAEAGTVAHETGFSPRQLAEQRKILLAHIEKLAEDLEFFAKECPPNKSDMGTLAKVARAAIARAGGGAA